MFFFVQAAFSRLLLYYLYCIVACDCTYILLLCKFILFYSPRDYLTIWGIEG